jgi:urea transporter
VIYRRGPIQPGMSPRLWVWVLLGALLWVVVALIVREVLR